MNARMLKPTRVSLGLSLTLLCVACGGGDSSSSTGVTPPPSSTITSVSVSCTLNTVPVAQTNQCSATVHGTGSFNSAVSWSVSNVQGGNATIGTVASSGLYTAPAAVPTPYTVTVSATSTEDPTKSASASVIVSGTIATISQTISGASGGTITLPDGSSATIPAGLLTSDQTVTLNEYSVPLNQPANQLTSGTGPALYLSFSAPLELANPAKQGSRKFGRGVNPSGTNQLAGITFNVNFGVNLPSLSSAESALASFTNQSGQTIYQGVSGAIDEVGKVGQAALDQICLASINAALGQNGPLEIGVYFIELAAQPVNAPTQGLLVWNTTATQFLPFQQCPAPPPTHTLVVVHGMLSSVEGSYGDMLTNSAFPTKMGYDAIFGIDYDWWNGIQQNGQNVAAFFDTIANCAALKNVDIMAHSEGVPVSMSALTQSSAMELSIQHLIVVAGPILGTPIANVFTGQLGTGRFGLLMDFANWPLQQMVFPPASLGGLQNLLNSQFTVDLETNCSGSNALCQIRSSWLADPTLSQLPVVMVGGTYPDPQAFGEYLPLGACLTGCFGIFQNEPFDGVVGLDSAFAAGLDLRLYRIPAVGLFHTAMVDNPGVLEALESQLGNAGPPALTVSTTSASASCADNRSCSGNPGSVFTFSASSFMPSTTVQIYTQDLTGTQDTPVSVQTDSTGNATWEDATPCSKAVGTYGIWLYDPVKLWASNGAIETVTSGSCVVGGVTVSVSPTSTQVAVNGTQQFSTIVTGTSDMAVTWTVNGINGGNSTVGTVSAAGLYTAPAVAPNPPTVTVTATSHADTNVSASAIVTITTAAGVTVSISPSSVVLRPSGMQTFTASVTGSSNTNVTWSVQEGALGGTITSSGVYTAPTSPGTFHVVATSQADHTKSSTASVTVVAQGTEKVLYNFQGGSDSSQPLSGLVFDNVGNLYGTTNYGGTVFELSPSNGSWSETIIDNFGKPGDGSRPEAGLIFDSAGNLYGTTASGGASGGCGTAFELTPSNGGWTETILLSFYPNPYSGCGPDAGLILDSAGNLYGTTVAGGANQNGTVFELSPSIGGWTETVLDSFPEFSSGYASEASLIFDSIGNLYGTTSGGGANEDGTVFELSPSNGVWTETVLHSFNISDGCCPPSGLIFDNSGNLYGTTIGGGANGDGTIFELTPSNGSWALSTLHSFNGSDGANPYAGLIFDGAGNLYGTTSSGGANGDGTVFELTPSSSGWALSTLHSFNGSDGSNPRAGLTFDSAGNLYGTAVNGGTAGDGVVFEIIGASSVAPGISVSMTAIPPITFVEVSATLQFTATVTGTSNQAVNWSVNAINGGNSTVGTINAQGLYTAPATVPSAGTVAVTVTSQAYPGAFASETITICPPPCCGVCEQPPASIIRKQQTGGDKQRPGGMG